MTLRDCLDYGTAELAAAGVPDAALDAWYLLEYVTGMSRVQYYLRQESPATPGWEASYRSLIGRRRRRIPLQHLTGETEFMGLPFLINESVLIPRQDTETLAELALNWSGRQPGPLRALDLCTGSGCVAVSLSKLGNFSSVLGTDISSEALRVAEENGRRNGCGNLEFRQSDLFGSLAGERFSLITANPPYIPTGEIDELMPEVRDHDPRLALDGREDGLYFYRRMAAESPAHLTEGGRIFWEIGWNQGEAVAGLLRSAGFRHVEVRRDDGGNERVITGEWKCLTD